MAFFFLLIGFAPSHIVFSESVESNTVPNIIKSNKLEFGKQPPSTCMKQAAWNAMQQSNTGIFLKQWKSYLYSAIFFF